MSWIKGVTLKFSNYPCQNFIPKSKIKESEVSIYQEAIDKLLNMGAISQCLEGEVGFISPYFLREKPDGSFRFILNLKNLNEFLNPPHFKLEDYRTAKNLILKDYYLTSLDLKDAYFLVKINQKDRKFLRFIFNNKIFEFNCLPFGLSLAPYIFTKINKPVLQHLRENQILCVGYLDDLLIISPSKITSQKDTEKAIIILKSLGFIINWQKCSLTPSKSCKFLGFIFNSENMTMSLPQEKSISIINNIKNILNKRSFKIRELAELIGKLVAASPAVKYGWLYTKMLERDKYLALKIHKNFEKSMSLSMQSINDLKWWLENLKTSHNQLSNYSYDYEIFTDSSKTGWGAVCGSTRTHGFWHHEEREKHINWLELAAALYGIKSFTKNVTNSNILLRVDNTTAIAYINRMGGIKYKNLNQITRELWQYCESKNLWVFASYINTNDNTEADKESRLKVGNSEFTLSDFYFQKILNQFGTPDIDLFASKLNSKCQNYVSWKPDPDSVAIDSFTIPWTNLNFYAFPPFAIIVKVLNKIITDKAEGVIVIPDWKSQPWFSLFVRMLSEKPIFFKPDINMLSFPSRDPHPLWKDLTLVAAKLSWKLSEGGGSQT